MTAATAHRIDDAAAVKGQVASTGNLKRSVDLLAQAIDRVRPMLVDGTTKQRIRVLWAAAKHARNLGASDVIHDAFTELAIETGLIDARGRWVGEDVREGLRRFGKDDVSHVIAWAMRGSNPFEEGPLT